MTTYSKMVNVVLVVNFIKQILSAEIFFCLKNMQDSERRSHTHNNPAAGGKNVKSEHKFQNAN